uniref:Uncharacterized protein n=1 Tax=Anopheles funestus TaxID=62324 RepID=A0A182RG90_ANOFN
MRYYIFISIFIPTRRMAVRVVMNQPNRPPVYAQQDTKHKREGSNPRGNGSYGGPPADGWTSSGELVDWTGSDIQLKIETTKYLRLLRAATVPRTMKKSF